jgi:hypothetical protein
MPDLNEPEAQGAAIAFGLSCVVIALLGGNLSEDPTAALRADGLMALLATLYLVFRSEPGEAGARFGDLLPLQVKQAGSRRRYGVNPRVRAHLWFAQWMAALSAFSLAASLFVG